MTPKRNTRHGETEVVNPAGPTRIDLPAYKAGDDGRKVTVFALARELGTPMGLVIHSIEAHIPSHPKLPSLGPNSVLGPLLAQAVRQDFGLPPTGGDGTNDVVWLG